MFKTLLLGFVIAMSLIGCASVPRHQTTDAGQDHAGLVRVLADSEQSHSFFVGLNKRLFIKAVDGKSTNTACFLWPNCYAQEVFVEPGRRYLELKFAYQNSYAEGAVWFDAEVGRGYIVRKRLIGYGVQFWVEDASTGIAVGGSAGSENDTTGEK